MKMLPAGVCISFIQIMPATFEEIKKQSTRPGSTSCTCPYYQRLRCKIIRTKRKLERNNKNSNLQLDPAGRAATQQFFQ